MVLIRSHYMIFIKKRDPMKQGKEEPEWPSINRIANTVNRHMIADKLNFIFVVLEHINHKLLLKSK